MKSICVLSGGMDSTTLLYHLLEKGDEVKCISFDYGQRHKKELEYASKTCKKLNVDHKIVDLSNINELIQGSALTSPDIEVPEGHYEDKSMKITVVPNRNMMMLSIAGAHAVSQKADRIATAVHAGDHQIYCDCRPEFIDSFEGALQNGNYHKVDVYTPYLYWSKAQIAAEGLSLGIDYDEDTYSCYKGGEEPCGKCGTCVERTWALEEAKNIKT